MCRLFGFRSVIDSKVHSSLVGAENALVLQSEEHSDGWGVAYYIAKSPHVVKSIATAIDDQLFSRVSGLVSSQTVVAHLRRATLGDKTILNTHPFQFGKWIFAHNGNIKDFDKCRPALLTKIAPELRRFIFGDTDSELIFYLFLTELAKRIPLDQDEADIEQVSESIQDCIKVITDIAGESHDEDGGPKNGTYLTFILTNGVTMVAHQGGRHLYYSTYKTQCPDRNHCTSYSPECENPTKTGKINHLLFSSEPLSGENIWLKMPAGKIIGTDGTFRFWES